MAGSSGFKILCTLSYILLSQSSLATAQPQELSPVDGSLVVRAAVAFHQPRLQEAEELLNEISDPESERFGSYLDARQLVGNAYETT